MRKIKVASRYKNITCSICNSTYVATSARVCPVCNYSFLTFEKNPKKVKRDMREYRLKNGYQKEFFREGEVFEFGEDQGRKILWRVLKIEEEKALVITEHILMNLPYEHNPLALLCSWEKSSIRKWLNTSFLTNSFTSLEQQKILETTIVTDINSGVSQTVKTDTTDKIFLLSTQEAEELFPDRVSRKADYREEKSIVSEDEDKYYWWWLRSAGEKRFMIAGVNLDGRIDFEGEDCFDRGGGVRPAMWLNLKGFEDVDEIKKNEPTKDIKKPEKSNIKSAVKSTAKIPVKNTINLKALKLTDKQVEAIIVFAVMATIAICVSLVGIVTGI